MNILMNRASFARSSMLANWHGQSPQTDEQRRAMFARLGGGGGRNAVPASASTSRLYPENPPEQAKDPRGEIRAETWQDRLRKVVDAAGRIGYVGEPAAGDPAWKYALATAVGLMLPFPGGKVKAAGKVADAVVDASTAIKQARSLQAQALRLRRLAAKTADPTEQSWLLEMAQRFSGWSDDLLGAKPYSIADETLLKVAEKAGKPSFQEVTKAQIPLLQKAGITSDEDLVLYSLSSVADGQVLRETTEAVLTGKMTEAEAVAKLKADFAKLKTEKAGQVMRIEDLSPAERAEYEAWSANVDRQVRDPLPADFGLVPDEYRAAENAADDAHNTLMALSDERGLWHEGSPQFKKWQRELQSARADFNKKNAAYKKMKEKYPFAYPDPDYPPGTEYGLSPEEAFNPFGTDDDYLPFRAANPRSRFMLNYAYRPVFLANWGGPMTDEQRRAMFARRRGGSGGSGGGRDSGGGGQSQLFSPVQGGGAVKAPPNDGYAYRYDPALQSWVRGPALSDIKWPDSDFRIDPKQIPPASGFDPAAAEAEKQMGAAYRQQLEMGGPSFDDGAASLAALIYETKKKAPQQYAQSFVDSVLSDKKAARKDRGLLGVSGSLAEEAARREAERQRKRAQELIRQGHYPNRAFLANAWVLQPKPTSSARTPSRKPFQWPAGLNMLGDFTDYMKGMIALGEYNGLTGQGMIDFLKAKYAEGANIFAQIQGVAPDQPVEAVVPEQFAPAPDPVEITAPAPAKARGPMTAAQRRAMFAKRGGSFRNRAPSGFLLNFMTGAQRRAMWAKRKGATGGSTPSPSPSRNAPASGIRYDPRYPTPPQGQLPGNSQSKPGQSAPYRPPIDPGYRRPGPGTGGAAPRNPLDPGGSGGPVLSPAGGWGSNAYGPDNMRPAGDLKTPISYEEAMDMMAGVTYRPYLPVPESKIRDEWKRDHPDGWDGTGENEDEYFQRRVKEETIMRPYFYRDDPNFGRPDGKVAARRKSRLLAKYGR